MDQIQTSSSEAMNSSAGKDSPYPPLSGGSSRVAVELKFCFHSISNIDAVSMTAAMRLYVGAAWRDPRLVGRDPASINWDVHWRPHISVQNASADGMNVEPFTPKLTDAKEGVCYMLLWCEGSISAPMDLQRFPFDTQLIRLDIAPESIHANKSVTVQGSGMDFLPYCSLRESVYPGDPSPRSCYFLSGWDPFKLLLEWKIRRMEFEVTRQGGPDGKSVFSVHVHIVRKPYFYLFKVVMLLVMSSCLSFSSALIDPLEDYADRIQFIAAMFLATSAFLFIVSQDLPRVPYLTLLDRLIIMTFLVTFAYGGESALIKGLAVADTSKTDALGESDRWFARIFPLVYFVGLAVELGPPLLRFWLAEAHSAKTVGELELRADIDGDDGISGGESANTPPATTLLADTTAGSRAHAAL